MRTERVYTNETCNQNCGFCNTRRPRERRDFIQARAVRDRIDAALRDGPATLVLTGGEPTLRRDLASLIAYAKGAGASSVVLETNAALITHDRARELAEAGLDRARVHLPAWGEECDRITCDPGGFESALRGMEELAAVAVGLEASAPVGRENVAALPHLPEQLRRSRLPVEALTLSVISDAPDDRSALPLPSVAEAIETTEARARRSSIELRLDPNSFVPPCLFRHPARVSHLFTLTRGGRARPGYEHLPGCGQCVVRDRCPGLPVSRTRRETLEVRPLREDRIRRRLSVISSLDDQIARELVQDEIHRLPSGTKLTSRIVRINFQCNQACHFCFVSTHLPAAREEAVRAAIVEVARQGGLLVLSGGEPTLNPKLVDYIQLGWDEGASGIELQTNAIRMQDAQLTARIAEAGVDPAFISLHGSRSDIADTVTAAPGTFDKQVLGIDQAVRHGIPVRLNFVFNEHNREDFPAYVDMVAERWPRASLTVSFVAPSTDVVPRTKELIPRYSDVLPFLAEGLRRAQRHGTTVSGFDSMCGIPLCLVPSDVTGFFSLADIPEGTDRGEFVQSDACRSCALQKKCFGVRRGYASMYGTDEFSPVRDTAFD